jgi:hypothetical protein
MRQSQSSQTVVICPEGEWTQIVPYSVTRVALIISTYSGSEIRLALRTRPDAAAGLWLPLTALPLVLTMGDHGEMVRGSIFAAPNSGQAQITIWETHLPERLPE